MTIRSKILAGCLALTLLTGLLGLYAQRAEQELGTLALRIYDDAFMGVSHLRAAQAGFATLANARPAGPDADAEALAAIVDDLAVARRRAMSPAGQTAAEGLSIAVSAASAHPDPDTYLALQDAFERAVETFASDGYRYRQGVSRLVAAQERQTMAVLVAILTGALVITVVLNRLIAPPVRHAVRIAQAIAAGQLDNPIRVTGQGETADLLRALATMQASIAAALAQIRALMADEAASHAGALAQQHARMEAALGNMNQGLCLFGADGRLAVCNRRFADMFGAPVPGAPAADVLHAAGLSLLLEGAGNGTVAALTCELADGRTIAVSQQPVAGGGWVATYEDTSERRATEARLARMARHDPVTGLPNRLGFTEHLQGVLARGRRGAGVAVLRVGLDRFRAVSGALGQRNADALLCQAVQRLKGAIRETDLLVRMGSDEFAVIQETAEQPVETAGLAARLIAVITEPFTVDGQQASIGASVGIAVPGVGTDTADTLLQAAGLALSRAEADGRGSLRVYEAGMDEAIQLQRTLESDLRRALAERQLVLFYQPLVHPGGIAGFEALLRWRHPDRGLVSPAVFIPIAEETGLIGEIGAWVMEQACADAATWPGALKVAVNLSPVQFRTRSLPDDAARALALSGLPSSRLELEITESVLIQDDASVLSSLHALRRMGIRIAMDDFGTGYSSLSYLHRFPFDKIKVDQSFVRGMTTQEDSRLIVRAIIGLGRSLGMAVNAEGVETPEQLDLLRQEGCGELQGYLFSKPRPGADVPDMLRQHGNATLVQADTPGRLELMADAGVAAE